MEPKGKLNSDLDKVMNEMGGDVLSPKPILKPVSKPIFSYNSEKKKDLR